MATVDLRGGGAPAGARRAADRVAISPPEDKLKRLRGHRRSCRAAGTVPDERAPDGRARPAARCWAPCAGRDRTPRNRARDIADRPGRELRLDAAVTGGIHPQRPPSLIETDDDSVAARSCTCCMAWGVEAAYDSLDKSLVTSARARVQRLDLHRARDRAGMVRTCYRSCIYQRDRRAARKPSNSASRVA